MLNITVTEPATAGFMTVEGADNSESTASTLDWTKGQTVSNLAVVGVGEAGVTFWNNGSGSVQLIADLFGYFTHDS